MHESVIVVILFFC